MKAKYDVEALRHAVRMRAAGATWGAIAERVSAPSASAIQSAIYRHKAKLDLDTHGYGWAVLRQDWRGHRIGADEPAAEVEIYADREAAEAAKASRAREDDVLICIASVDAMVRRRERAREYG